ncbi:hypothetical protein P8452_27913 [Trifolium repens]|nr:hypothetical protein P8452_27913 [Trifolium repens]
MIQQKRKETRTREQIPLLHCGLHCDSSPSLLNVEPPSSIAVAVCPPYHTYAVLPLLPPSPSSDSEETGKLEIS